MNYFVQVIAVIGLAVLIWDRYRMAKRLTAIEFRASTAMPFWRGLQTAAIKRLMHPHEAAERADVLLQLLKQDPTLEMSNEDRVELESRMKAVAAGEDPMITGKAERKLAEVMPVIMEQVQIEAANQNPIVDVQLLGIKRESE